MRKQIPTALMATALLATAFAAAGIAALLAPRQATNVVRAWPVDPLIDTDDDFLPDVVEWAVMTNATTEDTDQDGVSDFVEVVQRGSPRVPNAPAALDHEMRVVVTGPQPGSPSQETWLHLFARFATTPASVSYFGLWLETPTYPGLHIPIDILSVGGLTVRDRFTPQEGYWLQASVPMVSPAALQMLLPCSFHAEAVIDSRYLTTTVNLFDAGGDIASIMPFGYGKFAIQTIAAPALAGNQTNKVCVLELTEIGAGPGGSVYEVTHAECEDCNELECGAGCPESVGWFVTIPGGTEALSQN